MATRPARPKSCSQFYAQVRARMAQMGMRWTPGMAALLQVLEKGGFALTHEQIFFDLANNNNGSAANTAPSAAENSPVINRVTVYRLLERLETLGFVAKTIGSDRLSRFRLKNWGTVTVLAKAADCVKPPSASQGYFECLQCHTVEAMGLSSLPVTIRQWLDHAAPNGQVITEMMLRGTCGECAEAKIHQAPG